MTLAEILKIPVEEYKETDFKDHFVKIAQFIINWCSLVANKQKFRFVEIEFYCFHDDHHLDYFTHWSLEQ
mgnify:FL=1